MDSPAHPPGSPVHVFFVDNFDSFSFNLVDDLRSRGAIVSVWRNSVDPAQALEQALAMPSPRLILLSPGPGKPKDAGCCEALVKLALGKIPIFGVCLGLQAMVEACGGAVGRSAAVVHGKGAWVHHDGSALFDGLPTPLQVGRYHSLVATDLGPDMRRTAEVDGMIMAISHEQHPAVAVQFHPESVLTAQGGLMIDRLLTWCAAVCPGDGGRSDGRAGSPGTGSPGTGIPGTGSPGAEQPTTQSGDV